ncbi:MAG: secretin N-terminal domain-containing protein [Thermodesulfovibrionales bacterium]
MKFKQYTPLEKAIDAVGGHHPLKPMAVKRHHKLMPAEIAKTLTGLTVLLLLLVTSCAPKQAVKQEEQPAVPPATEAQPADSGKKTEIKEVKPAPAVEKKAEEQYVMLNFENADIGTVINTVSEMLKMNYILSPGVTGKITIQSRNKVPLSELFSTFQTILEFNGFTAVKDGSFYRIVPIDTVKQQPVQIETGKKPETRKDASFVTQQIPLEYVKANDVANVVRNLMPRGTDIIVYEPSNMLIVTSSPSGIVKTMKLLEAIDIPSSERDAVRTFVYYVENGEAKNLAGILKSLYGKQKDSQTGKAVTQPTQPAQAAVRRPATPAAPAQPAAAPQAGASVLEGVAGTIEGDVVFDSYEDINALIIKATPRAYLALLDTIKKLDTQPKQVLIEVLIAEISLDDTTDLGLEWVLKGHSRINNQNFDYITGNTQNPRTFFDNSTTTTDTNISTDFSKFVPVVSSGLFANIIDPTQFNILINAAATSDKVNVLASPHILALDNKEAKIEIADEVPVASTISQPQTTTELTTSQIQFKSVGTILTVTPQINEKKQVTLKIAQEVSELGKNVLIAGQAYQGFTTRKANTTAIVQDGHTLVIGGLIRETSSKTSNGIPFLSKIPVLGFLFGTTTDSMVRQELILMVTPHVVGSQEEADALTEEYTNKVKGLKNKIEERQQAGKVDQADIHIHETPEGANIEERQKQQDGEMIIPSLIIK